MSTTNPRLSPDRLGGPVLCLVGVSRRGKREAYSARIQPRIDLAVPEARSGAEVRAVPRAESMSA